MPMKFSDGQVKFSETISQPPLSNFWLWERNIQIYLIIKVWQKGKKSIWADFESKATEHKKAFQCNEALFLLYFYI